ncbi:hypothetical protein M9Y10_041040 [Tritrichomonas musculus]|uniref:Thioredoxin domain-containing protein n=1 Tax=Tritrichomonas musculus TaxID=1915356 RepID=A0ABR2K6C5_9EUKA
MILFSYFVATILAYFPFQPPVVEGTTSNWVEEVTDYVDNSVCFIMFIQKRSPRSKSIFPDFQEAANRTAGLIKFVSLDIKEHPKVAYLYTVRTAPSFRIVHHKGVLEYKGEKTADAFIETAFKYFPSKSHPIDDNWAPSPSTPLSAILLTHKKVIPPFWSAISCNLSENKNINVRVGHAKNSQFMSLFKVSSQSIIFVYKDIVSIYDGPLEFENIYSALLNFAKNPKSAGVETSIVSELTSPDDFEKTCKNTGKFCVFAVNANDETYKKYENIAKTYHRGPFRFLKCTDKCPLEQMKSGFFVFHAKRQSMITDETIEELVSSLDRVVDGGATWKKLHDDNDDYL